MFLPLTRAETMQSLMFLSARVAGGEARRGGSWGAAQELIYLGPHGFAVFEHVDRSNRCWGIHPPLLPRAMREAPSSPPAYATLTRAERTQ